MQKLNVRRLGGRSFSVGVGPCSGPFVKHYPGKGKLDKAGKPTDAVKVRSYPAKPEQRVMVTATDKRDALSKGKVAWRAKFARATS